MKKFFIIVLAFVALLAVAASVPKLLRLPEEVAFFESVGLSKVAVLMFGVLQLAGGVLLLFKPTRLWAALATGLLFLASAVMVLWTGRVGFALVSLVPVLLAGFVAWRSAERSARDTANQA